MRDNNHVQDDDGRFKSGNVEKEISKDERWINDRKVWTKPENAGGADCEQVGRKKTAAPEAVIACHELREPFLAIVAVGQKFDVSATEAMLSVESQEVKRGAAHRCRQGPETSVRHINAPPGTFTAAQSRICASFAEPAPDAWVRRVLSRSGAHPPTRKGDISRSARPLEARLAMTCKARPDFCGRRLPFAERSRNRTKSLIWPQRASHMAQDLPAPRQMSGTKLETIRASSGRGNLGS